MTKRAKKAEQLANTIELLPGAIIRDPEFNARKEYEKDVGPAESPSDRLSDEQLQASIAEQGVLSPPMVMFVSAASGEVVSSNSKGAICKAVFGFRRLAAAEKVAPDKPVLCGVHKGSFYDAKLANLSENLHRRDLKPWEISEALYSIRQEDPTISNVDIAKRVGLTASYVGNLLRVKERAHPDVWEQFRRWGMSLKISYRELLEIVMLPSERQLEEWNVRVEAKKQKHPSRGKEQKPGPAKLRVLYNSVDGLTQHTSEFRRGLKFALAIALGTRTWEQLITTKKRKAEQ